MKLGFAPSMPVNADLRPVQAGGPLIWVGGASEAVRRRTPAAILTR
jgi:hypothetical protein